MQTVIESLMSKEGHHSYLPPDLLTQIAKSQIYCFVSVFLGLFLLIVSISKKHFGNVYFNVCQSIQKLGYLFDVQGFLPIQLQPFDFPWKMTLKYAVSTDLTSLSFLVPIFLCLRKKLYPKVTNKASAATCDI